MNNKLIALLLIVLSLPALTFAQKIITTQQRMKRAQLMNQTVRQVQSLQVAVLQYSLDNKGNMPPMNNITSLKQALKTYAGGSDFISKASGKPFVPNAKLSGKKLVKSNRIVWFYDPQPISGPNSPKQLYRVVGYSTYTIAMPESRWQREKEDAGLP